MIRRVARMIRRSRQRHCTHGEEHTTWNVWNVDVDAGTASLMYCCGLCDAYVPGRTEQLSEDEIAEHRKERALVKMLRETYPNRETIEIHNMVTRMVTA